MKIKIQSKTRPESGKVAIRVNDKWVNVSKKFYDQVEWKKEYEVSDSFPNTDDATELQTETKKPYYEKAVSEKPKGDFRNPFQIMRSSAIGLALSFTGVITQNDIEKSFDEKKKLAFELAEEVMKYIEG